MSGRPRGIEIGPPWKGLEMREAHQTPQHDDLAVNVDYSYGRKEARRGFTVTSTDLAGRTSLHLCETPLGDRYMIAAGPNDVVEAVFCYLLNEDGTLADPNGNPWNLTALFGEPWTPDWQCGFVDTSVIINGYARFVTIISTKATSYVFDPMNPAGGPQRLSTNRYDDATPGHAIKAYQSSLNYWVSSPRGSIACEHQGAVFYAGFLYGTEASLTNLLEANQDLAPEAAIKPGQRNTIMLAPWLYCRSDPYDPAGLPASGFAITEDREPITGLCSAGEVLYIFTSKSVYARTGGLDTYSQRKMASVGCVAPRSIVEVQGVVYFLSYDGVYAVAAGGVGGAVKVSGALDPMFLPRVDKTFVSDVLGATVITLCGDWPPRVAHSALPLCEGLYVPSKRQIWWSLPVGGRTPRTFPITLVLDLVQQAWSLWAQRPMTRTNGDRVSCMVGGCTVRPGGAGREQIYTTNTLGEVQRYGHYRDGSASAADWRGVAQMWLSPRLGAGSDLRQTYRTPWFQLLGLGKVTGTQVTSRCVLVGEGGHQDAGDTEREEAVAALDTHPRESTTTSVWGVGTWGTMTWHPIDWFTSSAEAAIKTPYCRVGIIDDPNTDDRPNLVCVHSFGLQADPERTS